MSDWNIDAARSQYRLAHWSGGYFDINTHGHVVARPLPGTGGGIDLVEVVSQLRAQDIQLPVLLRFTDILRHRIDTLCGAFAEAMQADGYTGAYTAVYPIKVNQQHSVVDHMVQHAEGRIGLECGSKPELLAVLAALPAASGNSRSTIVCNGYKDREFIRLALIAQQLGHQVFIVVEKLSELELVLDEARKLAITPCIGVRIRLASIGVGKWQNTGGEKSKFGMSAAQILAIVERLQREGCLDILQMLHFHLGSQIANIQDIQRGVREAARYFAELSRMGAGISHVDVGGGLGIDYEGSRSRSYYSMNYSVQEYAAAIVHSLYQTCNAHALPHPHIITESGRAMTAHHAVLITDVLETEQPPAAGHTVTLDVDAPVILRDMQRTLEHISAHPVVESWHNTSQWLGEAQEMYSAGKLSLAQRADAELLYFAICHQLQRQLQTGGRAHHDILDELNGKLADKYFCNMSIFQSLPDIWAIQQLFPIMPLQRLDEAPTRRGVIHDLTCDSDGRIDRYVDGEGVESTLPLHALRKGEPYLLGFFLTGAYQEILGDMHNLFGDTNSIDVELTADGYQLVDYIEGDYVDDVLRYVHFDPSRMRDVYREKISAVDLGDEQREFYLKELEQGLGGYTYMED